VTAWVFNASPLILLGKIDRLDLLDDLPPSFIIPASVSNEILAGPDDDPAKIWIQTIGSPGSIVPDVSTPPAIHAWDLGSGETAVLSLVSSRDDAVCVLDDLAARNCAEAFQLPVLGTLGILLKAKVAGLIPLLQPEIANLLAVGSLLSPAVIQRALNLADETNKIG
jgi:predicted nucleic acid-binding protein